MRRKKKHLIQFKVKVGYYNRLFNSTGTLDIVSKL